MPESFATERFFALHAYKVTNAAGESRFIRFRVVPEAGTAYRAADATAGLPPNVLFDELGTRVARGPVRYRLLAQVAAPGDPTNDPTQAWPEDRPLVELGTISVTRPVPDSADGGTQGRLPAEPGAAGAGGLGRPLPGDAGRGLRHRLPSAAAMIRRA